MVQIIAYTGQEGRKLNLLRNFSRLSLSNSNLTYIDFEETSAYSTSASAKAVSQDAHQYTGFKPFSMYPLLYISPKTLTCSASYSGLIVKYGFSQFPRTPKRRNSFSCPLRFLCANSLHFALNSPSVIECLPPLIFFTTAFSIGNPCPSYPGTIGA